MNEEALWRANDVSKYLGVTITTVYRWVSRREIPFIKLPDGTRFRRASIEAWLARRSCSGKGVKRGVYLEVTNV